MPCFDGLPDRQPCLLSWLQSGAPSKKAALRRRIRAVGRRGLGTCHGRPGVTPAAMSAPLCRAISPTIRWRVMRTFTPGMQAPVDAYFALFPLAWHGRGCKRWHNAYGRVSHDKPPITRPTKQKPRKSSDLRGFATITGGDGGIRTLDPGFGPDAPLAGECLRPLGHVSQTFGRAGSQRDEAKIIAGRTAKVNV